MPPSDNAHLRRFEDIPDQADHDGLPDMKDTANNCHARPAEKPVFSLHFIMPDGKVTSYQYVHLESNSNFTPEYICIKFSGSERWQIQIYGRNLWRVYDLIHSHRMRWVRQAARDMGQETKGEAVVTEVKITKITEE